MVATRFRLCLPGVATPIQDPLFHAVRSRLGAALTGEAERELADLLARGHAAWPALAPVDADLVAEMVRRHLEGAPDPSAALRRIDAAEVWLCVACASGCHAAHVAFDERHVALLAAPLRAMGLDAAAIDDVKQRVRDKLLGPGPGGVARLPGYAGDGRLQGLVKVVGMRLALDALRARSRRPDLGNTGDATTVARLMDGELGPEMRLLAREQRELVRSALHEAIAALPAVDRGVLRLHLLEGLGIDEISALHAIHRSTAARWLVRIRERIGQLARETLHAAMGLDHARIDSLLRAVDSQIDLSLSRILPPSAP